MKVEFSVIENPIVSHGQYSFSPRIEPDTKLDSRIQHTIQHLVYFFSQTAVICQTGVLAERTE